ncbi:MAG TPA: serine/threonine-protein kinase [Gallionellaceae bacterium]|nr:serine/threonine-protein kinase [Gallionellaceae bacterium]
MINEIGKYAIVRELAAGATAKVYLAVDTFTNQEVALKLIDQDMLRSKSVGRAQQKLLQNEASLVGKLQHPHIVQMLDAVLTEEVSYIVLEYVEGGTLAQYSEPDWLLQFPVVADYMFKCCKALEYAYSMGVIHRDIKPANIMLHNGEVKVADLGAAQIEDADSTQVVGIGSPYYMAPEQITGEGVSFRSDIYSLGVTMYELLTGKLPFEASNHAALISRIVEGNPPAPRARRPEVPEALEAIVMRAIQRDPGQRYQSWAEFARELWAFLNASGQGTPAVSDAEKFDALRATGFFSAFSDIALWEILPYTKWHKLPPGATILQEGDMGNAFFILTDGVAKVTREGKILDFLHKGDCFGEIRRLPESHYTRTTGIEAGTDCVLFEIVPDELKSASLECRYLFSEACLLFLLRKLDSADKRISRLVGKHANFGDSTQRMEAEH